MLSFAGLSCATATAIIKKYEYQYLAGLAREIEGITPTLLKQPDSHAYGAGTNRHGGKPKRPPEKVRRTERSTVICVLEPLRLSVERQCWRQISPWKRELVHRAE